MLDGDPSTFWMTTGLFPQEIRIELTSNTTHIELTSRKIKSLTLTHQNKSREFQLEDTHIQNLEIPVKASKGDQITLEITQGWSNHAAIYTLQSS